ncbi:MAG TPA: type III-B CRISPR module RAMP protein Cmr1 [Nitrospiraceae bacterium]|nr:type III-B CRISPR module RAMP protein Cmr1 [Nitrospiraceae bacterium]
MAEPLTIKLRTLTPLWTGGVDQSCDRLHETGLIGSLRWWYEALVRGLGGSACDPTDGDRCPADEDKRCVACDLFGCTGWGRKFRFQILDGNQNIRETALLNANEDVTLRFIELRPLNAEQRWLLAKTVEIAAKHGALGGKTPLKPQRRSKIGDDYGIVQVRESQGAPKVPKSDIEKYLRSGDWRDAQTKEPDLRWFFFVQGAFLWRRQINSIIGLSEDGRSVVGKEAFQQFLRGRRGDQNNPAISKKIFSFRINSGRIWGYAREQNMRDEIIEKLNEQLGSGAYHVKTGEQVLHEL